MTDRTMLSTVGPEAGLLLGAGRAILLQLAHPQIGLAIARHSDFASNPMSRLIHTLGYIYALSNGTEAQQRTIVNYVNLAHRPVHGTRDPQAGTAAYSALDPRLQLWVAATLYDSARVIGDQVLPAWEEPQAEQLYRQYSRLGDALQMPTNLWPQTLSDFESYFAQTCSSLVVTDETKALADELFRGRNASWWIRAGLPLMRDITIAQLPDNVRELFGFELTEKILKRNNAVLKIVWTASRCLPKIIRHAPMRLMLRHVDKMSRTQS